MHLCRSGESQGQAYAAWLVVKRLWSRNRHALEDHRIGGGRRFSAVELQLSTEQRRADRIKRSATSDPVEPRGLVGWGGLDPFQRFARHSPADRADTGATATAGWTRALHPYPRRG